MIEPSLTKCSKTEKELIKTPENQEDEQDSELGKGTARFFFFFDQ